MEKRQSNEEYIKAWFLEHNEFLPSRDDKEEMLEWLTLYVMTVEKYFGLNKGDQIIKEGEKFRYISGPAEENDQITHILNMVNYDYAYLDLDVLKKGASWRFSEFYDEGVYDEDFVRLALGSWIQRLDAFYRNYKFNKIIYRMDGKVYYADQELTEEDIAFIKTIRNGNQVQFDVDHYEDGSVYCW